MRHQISPRSLIIGSYAHQKHDGMINLGLEGGGLVVTVDDEGDVAEGRYLQTWSRLNLTMGGGYFRGRQHFALSLSDRAFAPVELEVEHTNAYAYAGVAAATNLIVLGGVGVDAFNRGEAHPSAGEPEGRHHLEPLRSNDVTRGGLSGASSKPHRQPDD